MPKPAVHEPDPAAATCHVAVIGDVVASRSLPVAIRAGLQEALKDLLVTLNQGFTDAIESEFVITTGDEFQGLLNDASIVPDILWATDAYLERARVRYGIGYGELYTPLQPVAIGMDGPAFHHAREAVTSARKRGWRGGVFVGFGAWQDRVLNGLARLLERHSEKLTAKQREVADMVRDGLEQTEIAKQLGVTRQAVSDHIRAMGWEAFAEGERALRLALGHLPQCR